MKFDFKFFLHNTASSVISFGWHFRETNLFFRKSEFKETFFREVLVLRQPYTKNYRNGRNAQWMLFGKIFEQDL